MAKSIKKKVRIAFFTTSRAEFGNMVEIISTIQKDKRFIVYLFVWYAFAKTLEKLIMKLIDLI